MLDDQNSEERYSLNESFRYVISFHKKDIYLARKILIKIKKKEPTTTVDCLFYLSSFVR